MNQKITRTSASGATIEITITGSSTAIIRNKRTGKRWWMSIIIQEDTSVKFEKISTLYTYTLEDMDTSEVTVVSSESDTKAWNKVMDVIDRQLSDSDLKKFKEDLRDAWNYDLQTSGIGYRWTVEPDGVLSLEFTVIDQPLDYVEADRWCDDPLEVLEERLDERGLSIMQYWLSEATREFGYVGVTDISEHVWVGFSTYLSTTRLRRFLETGKVKY